MNDTEWKEKYNEFIKLLKADGDNGKLWLRFATFLEEEAEGPYELLNALKTAQKLLPEIDIRLQIGNAYIDAYEEEKGLSLIRGVLKQNQSAEGYCYLAEAYYKLDRNNEAILACQEALNLDPQCEEAYYLYAESIRYESKEKAIDNYYKAIEIAPDYQAAWGGLGRELISLSDRIQEGMDCLNNALKLDPEDGWSMLFRANGFWKLGKIAEAEAAYKAAIQIFPDYSAVYKWYADFLKSQNRNTEMNEYMQKYNKLKVNE